MNSISAYSHENSLYTHSPFIEISREKVTKKAFLHVKTTSNWNLFCGRTPTSINKEIPILSGNETGIFEIPVNPTYRWYFEWISDHKNFILAENHLPMEGGYNFRDLGGIPTKSGKQIKWGTFFRSDDLYNLTNADLEYLSSIPLYSIVDLRGKEECSFMPDKHPSSLKNHYFLHIEPGSVLKFLKNTSTSKEEIIEAMKNLYRLFITNNEELEKFKKFFSYIQETKPNNIPLLFHCSAGKDRTGITAALLLSALGVPNDLIMKDYLVSNLYLGNKYANLIKENPAHKYLFTIIPTYLETSFAEIDKQYNNMETFLQDKLNVNIQKLREKFLYKI